MLDPKTKTAPIATLPTAFQNLGPNGGTANIEPLSITYTVIGDSLFVAVKCGGVLATSDGVFNIVGTLNGVAPVGD